MSSVFDPTSPTELPGRPGIVGKSAESPNKFPFDAFEMEDVETGDLAPILSVVNGWRFRANFLKNGTTKSANYTILDTDGDVWVATDTMTFTLPTAADNTGRFLYMLNNSVDVITIDGEGSETINGALTWTLNVRLAYVVLYCDGTEWFVVGEDPGRRLATQGAPQLYDLLPDRDCAVFDFDTSGAGILTRDSYGSDLQNASANGAHSASPAKFGGGSVHYSSTSATAYSSWTPFTDFMGLTAWSDEVAMCAWVRFGTLGNEQIIFRVFGDTNNQIQIKKNSSDEIEAQVSDAGSHVTSAHSSGALSVDTWSLVGFYWDGAGTLVLTIDDDVDSLSVATPTGTAPGDLELGSSSNSLSWDMYVDDLLMCVGVTIGSTVFSDHHTRGVPWTPYGVSEDDDLVLATGAGGAIVTPGADQNGTLAAASALQLPGISGNTHAVSAGQDLDDGARGGSSWLLTGAAATSWTEVDAGDYVVYGARSVRMACLVRLNGDGAQDITLLYLRRKGSSVGKNPAAYANRITHTNLGSGLVADNFSEIDVLCDSIGRFEYQTNLNSGAQQAWLSPRGYK